MSNFLTFLKLAIRERIEDWRRERFIRECKRLVGNMNIARDIEFARRLVVSGQTPEIRHAACTLMTLLIWQRSVERVRQMERERGLSI